MLNNNNSQLYVQAWAVRLSGDIASPAGVPGSEIEVYEPSSEAQKSSSVEKRSPTDDLL